MLKSLLLTAAAAATVLAAPAQLQARQEASSEHETNTTTAWDAGAVSMYPIHESCNTTQRKQIAAGLNETIMLADHAKQHILRWGNNSELYHKYFGELPPYEAIGAYDLIVSGDKGGVLFRCDDPDDNCHQDGWAGHWRGENATAETVICPLSYESRRWLVSMCGLGYTVAGSPTNTFWASDLMHRLYHMPAVGYGYIEHWAEDYEDAVTFAANNTATNTRDSDVLQYFALDAYAMDIAAPGEGCTGEPMEEEEEESTSASPAASSTPSQTSSAPAECHTHSDGVVHCT